MNTCPHCHIRVGGDSTYCPLCQNRLPGPAEAAYFPATAPRIHRASLLYKIIAFLLSAVVVVAGAFDFLLLDDTPHRHFSLLLAVWSLAALRVLHSVLRRRYNGPRQIFNLLLLVSALLVFTDWFNGYTGYSLDLVVPILCCVALQLRVCLSAQPIHGKCAGLSAHEHRHRPFAVHPALSASGRR